MRGVRVKQLRRLAYLYYVKRINHKLVSFKRFFRRVKENYNYHGDKTIEAMKRVT